jgi:hypothetical protein
LYYELLIERLCKRYKKLPTEILELDREWIELMEAVINSEVKARNMEQKRMEQKSKVRS